MNDQGIPVDSKHLVAKDTLAIFSSTDDKIYVSVSLINISLRFLDFSFVILLICVLR